jgi:DNA-binding transcriptional MerR regulator/effector-binding domain-containing protein
MLRHYDRLGLFRPDRVDPATGYRTYRVAQLERLHRIVAFRDLGFSLEQVGELLDDDLPLDQLRGMLRLRRLQIEQDVADERARLARVEAHLHALEGTATMHSEPMMKTAARLRMAELVATAPGYGYENIGPVFAQTAPDVWTCITASGAEPGLNVAWFEWPRDDGVVVMHVGFEIGDQALACRDDVTIVELAAVEVAATIHRGPMEGFGATFEALVAWIESSGYRIAGCSRELYHEWHGEDPTRHVVELQIPIERWSGEAAVVATGDRA